MLALFLFLFGTAIGSFLTVAIDRIPKNISIVRGRSFCESCKHSLAWNDLIPIFSYMLLKGRCRYCGKKFGSHYLLMELLVGMLFVLVYFVTLSQQSNSTSAFLPLLLYRLLLVCSLFVLFFIDLKHRIIPLSVLIIITGAALIWMLLFTPSALPVAFLTGTGAFLFFLLLHVVTKGRGMGFGDVLFAFAIGLLLGFPTTIVAIYIAFLTGAIVSLILILSRRKKLKSAIPFGPFLVVGTVSCLLWGPQVTHAFLVFLRII